MELPIEIWICRLSRIENDTIEDLVQDSCVIDGNCGADGKPCDARKAVINWVDGK